MKSFPNRLGLPGKQYLLKSSCFVLVFAGLAGAAQGAPSGGTATTAKAPVVEISEVKTASEEISRRFPARIVSPSTVTLVPRVAGEISSVRFEEGQHVKAGDVLFEIDPIRLKANVRQARGTVLQAQAELERAKSKHKRIESLVKRKAETVENLESAARDAKTAEGTLETAYAQLTLAQDDLDHATVKSPVAGRIGKALVTVGNYVVAENGSLATIVVTDPMQVRFSVGMRAVATDFGTLEKLRQNARIEVVLADGTKLDRMSTVAFTDNKAEDTTDTVDVYAVFDNPDEALVDGSTVTVVLHSAQAREGVSVPLTSVMYDQNGSYVWVVDEAGVAQRRNVDLGNSSESEQFIRKGLRKGERVVSEGTHKVSEGVAVREAAKAKEAGK